MATMCLACATSAQSDQRRTDVVYPLSPQTLTQILPAALRDSRQLGKTQEAQRRCRRERAVHTSDGYGHAGGVGSGIRNAGVGVHGFGRETQFQPGGDRGGAHGRVESCGRREKERAGQEAREALSGHQLGRNANQCRSHDPGRQAGFRHEEWRQ